MIDDPDSKPWTFNSDSSELRELVKPVDPDGQTLLGMPGTLIMPGMVVEGPIDSAPVELGVDCENTGALIANSEPIVRAKTCDLVIVSLL